MMVREMMRFSLSPAKKDRRKRKMAELLDRINRRRKMVCRGCWWLRQVCCQRLCLGWAVALNICFQVSHELLSEVPVKKDAMTAIISDVEKIWLTSESRPPLACRVAAFEHVKLVSTFIEALKILKGLLVDHLWLNRVFSSWRAGAMIATAALEKELGRQEMGWKSAIMRRRSLKRR